MGGRRTTDEGQALPVWERPAPANRPAPSTLSRERIVGAAVALADEGGLAAVSLRKVAAALDAGPMRLYGYVASKEELLEVMVDSVYGEMVSASPGVVSGDWRDRLRDIARRHRHAARRHPWFTELLGGRPHLGPNALTHQEAAFATLCAVPGFEDIDAAFAALRVVNAYIIGAMRVEAGDLRNERDSGMNTAQWQAATGPYLERMIATGRFPNLARVALEATVPSPDLEFDRGLDLVLDGLATRLSR